MPQIGFNSIMCYYRGDIFILHSPQVENLGNFVTLQKQNVNRHFMYFPSVSTV